MMKIVCFGVYPVRRNLQIAGDPAAIRRTAVLIERAEDHVLHPVTIPVETVPGSVNNTLVVASDGSTRADEILTSSVAKKDLPHGRERISRVSVERGLPLLLGCLARAFDTAHLCQSRNIAVLFIGVGGRAHVSRCPMLDDNAWIRRHRVLTDRLPGSCHRSVQRLHNCKRSWHRGVQEPHNCNQVHNDKQRKKNLANRGWLDVSISS